MKYAVIEVPNNFEKGNCHDCPCAYWDWSVDDPEKTCVFSCRYDECPLEIKAEERVPFDFDLFEAGLMCLPKDMVKVLDKIRDEIQQIADEEQKHDKKMGDRFAICG